MAVSIKQQQHPWMEEGSFMQRIVSERPTNHHAELLKEANKKVAETLVDMIDDIEFEGVASYGKKCLKPFERKWLKIFFYVLLVKVRIVLENTLLAIGIGHLFEPAQNSLDAEAKASTFRELLSSDGPYKVCFTLFMLYMLEAKAYKWSKRLTI